MECLIIVILYYIKLVAHNLLTSRSSRQKFSVYVAAVSSLTEQMSCRLLAKAKSDMASFVFHLQQNFCMMRRSSPSPSPLGQAANGDIVFKLGNIFYLLISFNITPSLLTFKFRKTEFHQEYLVSFVKALLLMYLNLFFNILY